MHLCSLCGLHRPPPLCAGKRRSFSASQSFVGTVYSVRLL
nr:MAG TPA: hypothetical protein [Caudoviricetes sp.]